MVKIENLASAEIQEEKEKIREQVITKAAAALEVKKVCTTTSKLLIGSIGMIFVTALFSGAGTIFSTIAAAVSSFILVWFLVQAKSKIKYLDNTYDLKNVKKTEMKITDNLKKIKEAGKKTDEKTGSSSEDERKTD